MPTLKRLFARITAGMLVLLIAVFMSRDYIARRFVELGAERSTGFPIEVGSVDVSASLSRIDARNIRLINPRRYTDPTFVVMPRLSIEYRLLSMWSGVPHVDNMLIDVGQLTVVKNKQGKSNVAELKETLDSRGGKSKFRIDNLRVHVGRVTIKDYAGTTPSERRISLNIDASYKNITDSTDVTRLVLLTILNKAPLTGIGIDAGGLKKNLGNVTNSAGEIINGTAGGLQKAGKNLIDTLQKIIPRRGN